MNKGVTFFSEKCGPRNGKTKSCARPTCVPIEVATKECPNPPKPGSGNREPIVIETKPEVAVADAANDRAAAQVGKVKVIKGSVSITTAEGKKNVIAKEAVIRETDSVVAEADSGAVVEFEGGNKLHVHPNTEVKVKEFKDPKDPKSRKSLLELVRGKIRNQVEQKYNGKTSKYEVQTKAAVAGVRGTDFVMEFNEGAELETRVETLEGSVRFSGLNASEAHELGRGEGAAFVVANDKTNKDMSEFIEKGRLMPKYKIPAEKLRDLEYDSRVDVARRKKSAGSTDIEICDKPKAFLNQCAWQKVGADCIRRRCNANGQWAEDTKISPKAADACPASGFTVKDCDY